MIKKYIHKQNFLQQDEFREFQTKEGYEFFTSEFFKNRSNLFKNLRQQRYRNYSEMKTFITLESVLPNLPRAINQVISEFCEPDGV